MGKESERVRRKMTERQRQRGLENDKKEVREGGRMTERERREGKRLGQRRGRAILEA